MAKWSEMMPEGREVFYEGKDPVKFAKEMKKKFGFDPREDDGFNSNHGWNFFCPGEHLDEVYGSGKYPLGS